MVGAAATKEAEVHALARLMPKIMMAGWWNRMATNTNTPDMMMSVPAVRTILDGSSRNIPSNLKPEIGMATRLANHTRDVTQPRWKAS